MRLRSIITILGLALTLTACSEGGGYNAYVERYQRTDDPRRLIVAVTAGACDTVDRTAVEESSDRVVVQVWINAAPHDRPCPTMRPVDVPVTVELKDALGARKVMNSLGQEVRERGPLPLPEQTPPTR